MALGNSNIRFLICILLIALHEPASAQDQNQNVADWRPGAIDHAKQMRKYRDPDHGVASTPSVISKNRFDWNNTGILATYQPGGATFAARNAFFQDLGTNGRTCFTCHQPQDGWGLSAAGAQASFDASSGADPLFRLVDGATCPSAPISTLDEKRQAYKLVNEKGLIRVGLKLPASTLEFEVTAVDDPYRCTTNPDTGLTSPTEGVVSIYRRPLPATNLGFLASIMWDGREPSLESQAVDATLIHAQANAAPDTSRQAQIAGFEKGLFTAQIFDTKAHRLDSDNATGGPVALSLRQSGFYIGMNDPAGLDPKNVPFNPAIFDLYKPWEGTLGDDEQAQRRLSIARGEQVFNGGFCGRCHNTPDVGSRSLETFFDIGVSGENPPELDVADLPVFTLTCTNTSPPKVVKVTDPGRALITGRCADIGRFKVPVLRGLAARAPYFHNGSAKSLVEVVEFYNERFSLGFNTQQIDDLVNFLATL